MLWLNNSCVTDAVRSADMMWHTNVIKHVVIIWQAHLVYQQGFESLVSNATDTLEVIRVSTTIRGNTETIRLSASASEIADRA
jgi:hypothetical protein